jgi:hypothetical protein
MKVDAHRATRAESVMMSCAGMMRKEAAAQPLVPALALLLGKAPGKNDA